MKRLAIYKYYHPFEEVFKDISGIEWMKYNPAGVLMNSKDRLKKQYNISKEELYANSDKYYYHPAAIAQCALGTFNLIVDGSNKSYMDIFQANINWLLENGVAFGDSTVYPFPFGLPDFNHRPNWVSGMYQGQVLSALVRAYLLQKDKTIFSKCEEVYNSFFQKLGDKYGFRFETEAELWFEEAPQLPPKHILNGSIYAIWGLFDFMIISDNPSIKKQWEKSIYTLKENIKMYDSGFWSYYDQTGNLASYYYHGKVHILQLNTLSEQTSLKEFKYYADKWAAYSKNIKYRSMKKLISTYNVITRKRHRYNKKIKTNY